MLNKIKVILTIKILLFVGISFINSSISFSVEIDNEELNETYGPELPAEQPQFGQGKSDGVLTPEFEEILNNASKNQTPTNTTTQTQNATPKKRVVDPEVRPSRNSFGDTEIHRSTEPVSIQTKIQWIENAKTPEERLSLIDRLIGEETNPDYKRALTKMRNNVLKGRPILSVKPIHIFLFICAILICVGLSGVYQVITRKKGE